MNKIEHEYREFVSALRAYVDLESEIDDRMNVASDYSRLSAREMMISELHDLVAIFSAGMAVTEPKNMRGFEVFVVDSVEIDSVLHFYVPAGHSDPAETFLSKLREEKKFRVLATIHQLLTMAAMDRSVSSLILDGKILAQNKPMPEKNGRRS